MNEIILQSLGAAETVTGSKHLLKTPELTILIDCGLFQGIKSLREQNWHGLGFDPSEIDLIILTHAHLDHCGYIPLLVKRGFKGDIFMTGPTNELAQLILLDSAKIQEEDAENANRHHYTKHSPAKPLYTIDDAKASFKYFRVRDPNVFVRLSDHIHFQFKTCGHILGASSVELTCFEKKIIFSGDIGRPESAILASPDYFTEADFIVMESTYGDRLHGDHDPYDALAAVINETIAQKGNVLIPSFAVGRAQELIYMLSILKKQGKIPLNLPIIMDSPMASAATRISLNYADDYMKISALEFQQMNNHISINQDYSNTIGFIKDQSSKIVIAASGMLTGGRVLEYLKYYVGDNRNSILMIGFQAEGTRGRALLNAAHEVKIHGKYYPVKAKVLEVQGLSAHADQSELMNWIRKFKKAPTQIMLVHGEPCAQEALRVKIQTELNIPVKIMKQNQDALLFTCENSVVFPRLQKQIDEADTKVKR
ncbi:MBL fold metallo-hydrolase RNA specificity domain-containing protein [Pedobacter foliorum]|uniref:MBL fold metallo-hydrolase RNA specificity domain-containing protein n=1 Tax=Pedobacter foliorum TaxID=2739058 RepID=UPI0015667E59|nr:MBL fold metallo-hydrolase [Pedobacter foliorum]NRF37696.1 MBL fold metallo-hydrolase [Pedobacter foliorum]